MVEKADMADGLLLELEEERSRWFFIIFIFTILIVLILIVNNILIVILIRCDRLKECLEIERAEREGVEAGLGAEVRCSSDDGGCSNCSWLR